jgi:Kef-type K+ transport system membrane component KefB
MIAAAGYAGTSTLYGAYLGGLIVSHLDGLDITDAENGSEKTYATTFQTQATTSTPATVLAGSHELSSKSHNPIHRSTSLPPCLKSHDLSSTDVTSSPRSCPTLLSSFEIYIAPLLNFLLLPLFFGSIGYSIPFIPLWKGKIIWKGIIYALLMLVSKAVCGVCIWVWTVNSRAMRGKRASQRFKESSWAGSMVGCAMIARGEIGLLSVLFINLAHASADKLTTHRISQIAYHTPNPLLSEDEFLITTWAIVLCTIIGPMGVGWIVNRRGSDILRGGWD